MNCILLDSIKCGTVLCVRMWLNRSILPKNICLFFEWKSVLISLLYRLISSVYLIISLPCIGYVFTFVSLRAIIILALN